MAKFFYRISLAGPAGTGAGVIVFDDAGVVVGADAGGVIYQGHFRLEAGRLMSQVLVSIPKGVALVTGTPPPQSAYDFLVDISFPPDDLTVEQEVDTPTGRVRFVLRRLYTSV